MRAPQFSRQHAAIACCIALALAAVALEFATGAIWSHEGIASYRESAYAYLSGLLGASHPSSIDQNAGSGESVAHHGGAIDSYAQRQAKLDARFDLRGVRHSKSMARERAEEFVKWPVCGVCVFVCVCECV